MGSFESILTIGNFDGVHFGHQQIIQKVVERAKNLEILSKVVTFQPHPIFVLNPKPDFSLLMSRDQKEEKILSLGVDEVIFIPFNRDMADIDPRQFFVDYILKPHQPREIHIGYDFAFGKNRSGTVDVLKSYAQEFQISLEVHQPYKSPKFQEIVSSSKIRQFLQEGDVIHAADLLSSLYSLESNVVKGDGRGKKIGFPTANLAQPRHLIPKTGVYSSFITVRGKRFASVTNIGSAPTFHIDREVKVETHIFGFNEDIYGEQVKVEFLKMIRGEEKFSSIEKLIGQIKSDSEVAKKDCERYLNHQELE